MCVWRVGLAILLTTSISGQAMAQQPARQESVSVKVINAIVFLMKFTVENDYSQVKRGEENEVQREIADGYLDWNCDVCSSATAFPLQTVCT